MFSSVMNLLLFIFISLFLWFKFNFSIFGFIFELKLKQLLFGFIENSFPTPLFLLFKFFWVLSKFSFSCLLSFIFIGSAKFLNVLKNVSIFGTFLESSFSFFSDLSLLSFLSLIFLDNKISLLVCLLLLFLKSKFFNDGFCFLILVNNFDFKL